MAINITNYIKQAISKYNSDIDVSNGTAIADFVINPLSVILEPYDQTFNSILNDINASDPETISKERIDSIGANFLLQRKSGTKAHGNVIYFIFNSPRTLVIPKYTVLVSQEGFKYETVSDFSISKTQMESDLNVYPYYEAGPIEVYAIEDGKAYEVLNETTFTLESPLSITPIKIINKGPILNGLDEESNTDFLNRIKRVIYGKSLSSPTAIKSLIQEIDTNVTDVEIVGANSPEMIRDVIYNIDDLHSYISEDFKYVIPGEHNPPNKEHIALTGTFFDIDPSSEVAFPSVESWSTELTADQYKGIAIKDDIKYTEENQHILINQFNVESNIIDTDLALVIASGQWQLNDSFNPDQQIDPGEFSLNNGKLRLGKTIDTTIPNSSVKIPFAEYQNTLETILVNAGKDNTAILNAVEYMKKYSAASLINNQSPIIHKQIDQHVGIQIACSVMTTDNTELGEMSYITVLRNNKIFLPHDGYGLAWRKQPEFLIRMQYNNYTDNFIKEADLAKFQEEYGPNLAHSPEWYLGKIKDMPELWKFNVYLVDNDVLQENVWVGSEQIWDQTSGKNQFLVAGKVWIEANITYNVVLKFYQYMGFDAWIYDSTNTNFVLDNSNRCLTRGQTYPTYVPQSGDKFIAYNGVEQLDYYRNHFGIAVGETKNCEWYYSNLKVWSFVECFPMHLFRFKIDSSKVDINNGLNILYYGVGYDPTRSVAYPNEDNSRVKLGVYNILTDTWETLGYHSKPVVAEQIINIEDFKIENQINKISDYLDSEGFINIAATAANSGKIYQNNVLVYDFTNNIEHALRTYYININNEHFQGIHKGNATDIYVHDPQNIAVNSIVATVSSNKIDVSLLNTDPYIQEIIELREYISKTTISPSSYLINVKNKGTIYSDAPSYEILFDSDNLNGALIEIVYRYWIRGSYFNSIINSDEYRFPSADYMLKVMPPTVVSITNLEYSGSPDESSMKQYIKEFFNSLDSSFDKSDLVNYMYTKGANYVNLDMIINIRTYDYMGKLNREILTGQTYTLPNKLTRFYTDINELYGVMKI
jgi:hypothetical protein